MEQSPTIPFKEQGQDEADPTKTQPLTDYNEQIQEDPVDLCLVLSDMNLVSDPETSVSPPSCYEDKNKNVVDAEDASTSHESPLHEPQLHVNSFEPIHLLTFDSLPYEITEDIPSVGVTSQQASPAQSLERASMWPNETDLGAITAELTPDFLLPFYDECEDVKTDLMVPTESVQKLDELMFLSAHQNDLGLLQTAHPISEYTVCPQLLSNLTEWSSEGNLVTSGTVDLDCSLSFPRSESTEEAAMLPVKDNQTQPQLGPSGLLRQTDMLSASVPELLPNSSQSPCLDADWGSDPAHTEKQESNLTKGYTQFQQQPSCLTQPPQPQTFQLPPSMSKETLHLLQPHTISDNLPTKAHSTACQQQVLFSESNYIQPIQHNSTTGRPPIQPLDENHTKSEHQLIYYFQPSLCLNDYLPSSLVSDNNFNQVRVTYDNWPHLIPQLNLTSISSASHLNPDCSSSLPCADRPVLPPHFQINTKCLQLAHPITPGTFSLSKAEQPCMVGTISSRKDLSPKQYENYKLWQRYCKITKSVYTSTPDLEALACFFIPVIRSFIQDNPDLPFPTAVKRAVVEWEKHSNFDRMGYYHMAHKFMEVEEEELRAEEVPGTSKELTPIKQIPNRINTQFKGCTQSQNPYKMRGTGCRAQKAKGCSATPRRGQGVKGKVPNLAEEAFREYCQIMEGLQSRAVEGSEVMKELFHVEDELVEEGSFTEYLNELCCQKEFVTEVASEIDMAYISTLLSSDPNITDVLIQPEALGNAQGVASCIPSVEEACCISPQTTAGSFSLAPPDLHPPPQTYGMQSAPPLLPGLYMADSTIHPLSSSFKMPIISSQPKENYVPNKYVLGVHPIEPVSHNGVNHIHFQNSIPLNIFRMLPPATGLLNNLQMSSDYHNAHQGIYLIPETHTTPQPRNINTYNAFQASLSPHHSLFAGNDCQNINNSFLPFSNNQTLSQMADYNSQNALPHQLRQSWSTSESFSVENAIRGTITLMDKKVNVYTLSSSHVGQLSNDPATEENVLTSHSKTTSQALEELHKVAVGAELQNDPQSISPYNNNIPKVAWIRHKSLEKNWNKKNISSTIPCCVAGRSTSAGYKMKSVKEKKTKKNKFMLGKIKETPPDQQKDPSSTEGKSNMSSFLMMKKDVTERKTEATEKVSSTPQMLPQIQNYSTKSQVGHLQEVTGRSEEELAVAQILSLLSPPSYLSLDSPSSTRQNIISSPTPLFTCTERTTPSEKLNIYPIEPQEEEAENQLRNLSQSPPSLAVLSFQALRTSTHANSKLINKEDEVSEFIEWSQQGLCPIEFSHPHFENQFSVNDTLKDELPILSCFLAISESKPTKNMDLEGNLKGWSVISDSTDEGAGKKKASEDKTKTNRDTMPLENTSKPPEMIPQTVAVQLNDIIEEASRAQPGLSKVSDTTELQATPDKNDAFSEISIVDNDSQHLSPGHRFHVPTSECNIVLTPLLDDIVTVTQNEFSMFNPIENNQADTIRGPILACDAQETSWTQYLVNMLTDSTEGQLSPTGHLGSMSDWLELDMQQEFPVMRPNSTSEEDESMLPTHLLLSLEDEATINPLENIIQSTGSNSLPRDTLPGGTEDDHQGGHQGVTEVTKETNGSVDSRCSLTVEDVFNEGSGTKGESNMTHQIHVESPVHKPWQKQEKERVQNEKDTVMAPSTEERESLTTRPVLALENEPIINERFQCSLTNEMTHTRQDKLMTKRNEQHLRKMTGVMEEVTELKNNINLEVIPSILGENTSISKQIKNSSTITDAAEEKDQRKCAEYQATKKLDIQINLIKMDMTKDQKHDATGSVNSQNVNEDEIKLTQTLKDQSRKGEGNTRSCKMVPVRDTLEENEKRALKEVEWQAKGKSQALNKQQHVMHTRNRRWRLESPKPEHTSETQDEKVKAEKPNAIKPTTLGKDMKKANPPIGGAMKTTSSNTQLTQEGRRTRCHKSTLEPESESSERAARIKKRERRSVTPERNTIFDDSPRCGRSLRHNTSQVGIHFSMQVKSKAVTVNERRKDRIRQTRMCERGKAVTQASDKKLRERQQIKDCVKLLQEEEGVNKLKGSNRSINKSITNHKRKTMTGVAYGEEKQETQKRVKREEDDHEKNKKKDVKYHSVTTRAGREKREMATGNGFMRWKENQLTERQRNEKRRETEKRMSLSHGRGKTENLQQSDGLYAGEKAQANSPENPSILVSPKTRTRAKWINNGQEETKESQKSPKRVREGNAGRGGVCAPKKLKASEEGLKMSKDDDAGKSHFAEAEAIPPNPVRITRASLASAPTPEKGKVEQKNSGREKRGFMFGKGRQEEEYRVKEKEKKRKHRLLLGDRMLKGKETKATSKIEKLMNQERKKVKIRERWSNRLGKMQKKRAR